MDETVCYRTDFSQFSRKKRNLMEKVKQQQLGKKNETKTKKKKYQRRKEEYCVFTPQSISRDRGRR